jgi:hypothetical protein
MDSKAGKFPAVTTLAVIGFLAASVYVGTYLYMVQPVVYSGMSFMTMGAADWKPWTVATYPAAPGSQKFWERVFAPANAIDRKLRPAKWSAE